MKFKEFCKFQEGYVNPSQKNSKYFDGPYKWLRATDLNNAQVYETSRTLSEQGFKSAGKSSKLFKPNSIAISKSGTIGRLGILRDYMCGNRAVINIEINEEIMDPMYVFYWLLSKRNHIEELAVGSVQKNLYVSALENLDIDYVGLNDQKEISKILLSLDLMIDNNEKIINKLLEMTLVIYKYWFIDFEFPNEHGQPYKSSGGKMVENELGQIPIEWESIALKDIAVHKKDSITMNKIETEFVNHFSIPNYDATNMSSIDRIEDIKSSKYIIDKNSIMFSKLNPSTPRIWDPVIPNNSYQNVCSTEFVVINSMITEHHYYLLALVSSTDFTNYLMGNVKGSTGSRQRVSPSDALKYKFAFDADLASQFNAFALPLYEKIKILRLENERLTSVRDILLPQLLSGEIELSIKETVEN